MSTIRPSGPKKATQPSAKPVAKAQTSTTSKAATAAKADKFSAEEAARRAKATQTAGAKATGPAMPAPVDPSKLSVAQPRTTSYPTRNVATEGVKPPTYLDASGKRLSLDQVAENVKKSSDPVASVAALISRDGKTPPIAYKGYGSNLENARPSVADAWNRGHGECDAIMSVGAHLLVKSGAVPKEDVVVTQNFSTSGWHNVTIFRDPKDQKWKVMDYQKVVTMPEARNKEDAVRQYFNQNNGVSIIYKIDDENSRPVGLYQVKSYGVAMHDTLTQNPGIPADMRGNLATNRGVNDSAVAPLPKATDRPGMTATGGLDGGRVSSTLPGGTRMDAAVRANAGETTTGASVLTPIGEHSAAGGKVLYRESVAGKSLTVAGETWKINGGNFLGIVGGVKTEIDAIDRKGKPITTVGPFLAVSGGMTHDVVKADKVDAQIFWNGTAKLNAPFVLGKADRAYVDDNANGNGPDGAIDPGGLAANSGISANLGVRSGLRLSDKVTLNGSVTGHLTLTDPTLSPVHSLAVPFDGSVEARGNVRYTSGRVNAEVGASGTVGALYDKDTRLSLWATSGVKINDKLSIGATASGGQYVTGSGYLDAGAAVTYQPSRDFSLSATGGTSVLLDKGQPAAVAPRANVMATWHW